MSRSQVFKSLYGREVIVHDFSDKWDDTPLELKVDGSGGALIRRKDAEALRDLLIEIVGPKPEPAPEPEPPLPTRPGAVIRTKVGNTWVRRADGLWDSLTGPVGSETGWKDNELTTKGHEVLFEGVED